jgi:hypothetical protein
MSHLITYNRYMCERFRLGVPLSDVIPSRFYPNGQVLSLLVNEHDDPQHIIANLNLSLRMKACCLTHGSSFVTHTERRV